MIPTAFGVLVSKVVFAAWDPLKKGANIALSNGDRTAKGGAFIEQMFLGVSAILSTVTFVFSIVSTGTSDQAVGAGGIPPSNNYNVFPNYAGAVYLLADGRVFASGVHVLTISSWDTAGAHTITMEVNVGTSQIRFKVDGGAFSSNAAYSGTIFPLGMFRENSAVASITLSTL